MRLLGRAFAERPDPKCNLFFVREKERNNTITGKGLACAVLINERKFLLTSSDVTNSQGNNESSAYFEQYKSKNLLTRKRNFPVNHRCLINHSYFSLIEIDFDPDESFQVYSQFNGVFRPSECRSLVVKSDSYDTVHWKYNRDGYQKQNNRKEIVLEGASAEGSPVLWTDTSINQRFVVGVIRRLEGAGFVPEIFTQETLQQLIGECIINFRLVRYLAKYVFLKSNACLF